MQLGKASSCDAIILQNTGITHIEVHPFVYINSNTRTFYTVHLKSQRSTPYRNKDACQKTESLAMSSDVKGTVLGTNAVILCAQ